MASQLEDIQKQMQEAVERAHRLAGGLSAESWGRRPTSDRWSVCECMIHLNMTSKAFLPRLQEAVRHGREQNIRSDGPFRMDFAGWLLTKLVEPPYRLKVKTTPPFVPESVEPKEKVLAEFEELQKKILLCVKDANGLALDRLKIASPFAERMKYSVYSTFRIIPAHQRRHLWQAEQTLLALEKRR
jgi:hypothetical protein